jgi:threonine synthase
LADLPAVGIARLPALLRGGVWRYSEWIAVPGAIGERLSMGEGQTALIALDDVSVKLEFVSPTGSFKDRGAVALVASAVARGARELVADSSGNAGSAIAAYAARAGLPCTVFVPEGTSGAKRRQIEGYGAALRVVPGDRMAAAGAAAATVAETGAMYASHVWDPMFLQGTKTFAFECWEQLGRRGPDAVVIPVGNGTLVLGAARGFRELRAAGAIERLPRLIGLQSERCAPLAVAWAQRQPNPAPVAPSQATVAEGIAIPAPARGAQILAAVLESGGCVLSVPEASIAPAQRDLARRGLLVEPTAAVAWAAALMLSERLPAPADDGLWKAAAELCTGTVVVPLCGSGLKSG